jgi:hypothetical protein
MSDLPPKELRFEAKDFLSPDDEIRGAGAEELCRTLVIIADRANALLAERLARCPTVFGNPDVPNGDRVEALESRLSTAVAALEFYAVKARYNWAHADEYEQADVDTGDKARQALASLRDGGT